jgi:hypothetical protein
MDKESVETMCRLLRKGGCRSVHIGGGEPFINFEGLIMVIRALNQAGITVDYVETNAFWAYGDTHEYMQCLLADGVTTLCISIDPFHAEYVPYGAPLALAEHCEKAGMGYFLWKQELLPALSRLDSGKTHSRQDMEQAISKDYIKKTAQVYGIGYGGRAINIEREFGVMYPPENFTAASSPCDNLLSTGHFHVDKDLFFIPPRCTGLRIPLQEAIEGISQGNYPVFEALYYGGVSALMQLAQQHGFLPGNEGYPSKCSLCFSLRFFLSAQNFAELDSNHYDEAINS